MPDLSGRPFQRGGFSFLLRGGEYNLPKTSSQRVLGVRCNPSHVQGHPFPTKQSSVLEPIGPPNILKGLGASLVRVGVRALGDRRGEGPAHGHSLVRKSGAQIIQYAPWSKITPQRQRTFLEEETSDT